MRRTVPPLLSFFLFAASCAAEQAWFGQAVAVRPAEGLRLNFSNTTYTEHEKHFANEEAASFRQTLTEGWSAGAGITWGQDKIDGTWHGSGRPTEHVSFDWTGAFGGWTVFDAQRFDLKFREGERDWVVYRNIGSVTAPPLPDLPWSPRPYATEQFYVSSRECYAGHDRFCQLRLGGGVRLHPDERLSLSVYWQYRDIERPDGSWDQFRVAGISALLAL